MVSRAVAECFLSSFPGLADLMSPPFPYYYYEICARRHAVIYDTWVEH
jgi:hypothetical protein